MHLPVVHFLTHKVFRKSHVPLVTIPCIRMYVRGTTTPNTLILRSTSSTCTCTKLPCRYKYESTPQGFFVMRYARGAGTRRRAHPLRIHLVYPLCTHYAHIGTLRVLHPCCTLVPILHYARSAIWDLYLYPLHTPYI